MYWTRPRQAPPGAHFRIAILQGFTFRSQEEVDGIIKAASHEFMGTQWNLLKNNCNHFTSHLCQKLTGRSAPAWLNRAANIAIALPCLVPRAWLLAPDVETADGELVDETANMDNIDEDDEEAGMLSNRQPDPIRQSEDSSKTARSSQDGRRSSDRYKRTTDSSGRTIPVSERAPPPRG